jgi:protein-L-isoaspartate O-methyltransferase
LDFQPGQSFLNIGSGTGYFNAVVGYLLSKLKTSFYYLYSLAESGINHGVEIHRNLVDYAEQMLKMAIQRPATSAFSFCVPEFFHGSAFYIANGMRYDRIYCGALVPLNRRSFFCNMLKVGGILVMPYGSHVRTFSRVNGLLLFS